MLLLWGGGELIYCSFILKGRLGIPVLSFKYKKAIMLQMNRQLNFKQVGYQWQLDSLQMGCSVDLQNG